MVVVVEVVVLVVEERFVFFSFDPTPSPPRSLSLFFLAFFSSSSSTDTYMHTHIVMLNSFSASLPGNEEVKSVKTIWAPDIGRDMQHSRCHFTGHLAPQ